MTPGKALTEVIAFIPAFLVTSATNAVTHIEHAAVMDTPQQKALLVLLNGLVALAVSLTGRILTAAAKSWYSSYKAARDKDRSANTLSGYLDQNKKKAR